MSCSGLKSFCICSSVGVGDGGTSVFTVGLVVGGEDDRVLREFAVFPGTVNLTTRSFSEHEQPARPVLWWTVFFFFTT